MDNPQPEVMASMQRRTFLLASIGAVAAARVQATPAWQSRSLVALGTTVHLKAAHADPAVLDQALDAAVRAIEAVEASMSLFRPDSEVSLLNQHGRLANPSARLLSVLRTARRVSQASGGAFDVTVQPLWLLYHQAQAAGQLPAAVDIALARQQVGWRDLSIESHRVRFNRPGMAVTLNGIAQGYAADAAREALQSHGIEQALIDAGEFGVLGRNAENRPWTLGVEDPHDEQQLVAALQLDGRCLATSADNRSAFTADHRHHHIFDPATGDSPPALSSVTVAAPAATLADALTKVMFVAGPRRIPALARQWGVGVLWVDKQGRWEATPDLRLAG